MRFPSGEKLRTELAFGRAEGLEHLVTGEVEDVVSVRGTHCDAIASWDSYPRM